MLSKYIPYICNSQSNLQNSRIKDFCFHFNENGDEASKKKLYARHCVSIKAFSGASLESACWHTNNTEDDECALLLPPIDVLCEGSPSLDDEPLTRPSQRIATSTSKTTQHQLRGIRIEWRPKHVFIVQRVLSAHLTCVCLELCVCVCFSSIFSPWIYSTKNSVYR